MMHFSLIITMLKVIYPCALNHLYTLENMSQQTEDSNNTSDIDSILNLVGKEDYLSGVYNADVLDGDVLDEDIFLVGKEDYLSGVYNADVLDGDVLDEDIFLVGKEDYLSGVYNDDVLVDNVESLMENTKLNAEDQQKVDNLKHELIFDIIFTNDGDLVSESKENKRKATAHDSLPQKQ